MTVFFFLTQVPTLTQEGDKAGMRTLAMQTPVGSEPAKSRAHGELLPLLQGISSLRTQSLGESLCLCTKFKPMPETL